jgi:hypothetical protein
VDEDQTEDQKEEETQVEAVEEELLEVDPKIETKQMLMRAAATKAAKALNAAAGCFDELGLGGTGDQLRKQAEKVPEQGERAVKRVEKEAGKAEREAKKAEREAKRKEREATKKKKDADTIAKLEARLKALKGE